MADSFLRTRWADRETLRAAPSLHIAQVSSWTFCAPPSRDSQVLLGAVSYDPAVGTIWEQMRVYLNSAGCPFDFVLFTNYEQLVAALLAEKIDIAWNGPIAHVLSQHYAGEGGLVSLGMRDVDQDFVSVAVARKDSGIRSVADLSGRVVFTGASDSPQAHLVPLHWLSERGVEPGRVVSFDLDLGKHGDTALGEVKALEALASGEAEAALLSDMMWQRGLRGALPSVDSQALKEKISVIPGEAPPVFDHCQFDALVGSPAWKRESFSKAVFDMDMGNPEHEPVMKLEGIQKTWMPPREQGYVVVRSALASRGLLRQPASAATPTLGSGRRSFSTLRLGPRRSFSSGPAPSVGIVGGGVSGIQAVRAFEAKGFTAKLFEQHDQVGGVWRKNYVDFGIQAPKQLFEFPDFPFESATWGEFASGSKVQQYIKDYITHFKLESRIHTSTTVHSVTPSAAGWTFTTQKHGEAEKLETFDYCVVASGMYSAHRSFIPQLPGFDIFKGEVMHSSDFEKLEQVEGKKVVVVGGAKSAIDCAVAASQAKGTKVTQVERRPHWPVPRKILNLIPFQYIFLSRLGQALVVGYRGPLPDSAPGHMKMWHKMGWPVMAGAFKAVELLLAAQFKNISGPMSPLFKADFVDDFYGYANVLDYSSRDAVKAGTLDRRVGTVGAFTETGVRLESGEELKADVVVFGTGFSKDYSIFPDEIQSKLGIEADGLYLWRHTIHPNVPKLAFVGSELAVISNISGYAIQAAWLSKLWAGEMTPPSAEEMMADIEAMKRWKRSWMPKTRSRASIVLTHQVHYFDRLMKDMGLPHFRKAPNYLAEALMPYHSRDYDGVIGA